MDVRTEAEATDPSDRKLVADVAAHGLHIVLVRESEGEDDEPPAAYTVGLWATHGHPEVIVVGMPPEFAAPLLNQVGERIAAGERFEAGNTYGGLLKGMRCGFVAVPADDRTEYLEHADWFYRGAEFSAVQMVWPDVQNRLPWQKGADRDMIASQPLLGAWPGDTDNAADEKK